MSSTSQSLPLPESGAIDVWQTCLLPEAVAALEARLLPGLSQAEALRARQIRAASVRHEAVLVQASLRHLLGQYLHCDGASLRFVRGPYGKPALAPGYPPLYFNATYTPGFLAIAVATDREVGIDAESLQRPVTPVLFRKALAPEEQGACGRNPKRFLALWTLKEAYLKCIGVGLRVRPSKVAFSLDGPSLLRPAPGYESLKVQCWQQSFSGYCLALVLAGESGPPARVGVQALSPVLDSIR